MKNTIENSIHWQEMSPEEMQMINGGNWWTDFKDGFKEGFNWAWGVNAFMSCQQEQVNAQYFCMTSNTP